MSLRVIGIDPSLSATGIAVDDEPWTIATKPGDPYRLDDIYERVFSVADREPTSLAVVEDLPSNAKAAGLTGMAQGVIRLALIRAEVPYLTVPPATLKKFATSNGGAAKPDMRMALYKRAGLDLRDDNQVDAWWLRALGLQMLGHPAVTLPKVQVDALAKLTLPEGGVSR